MRRPRRHTLRRRIECLWIILFARWRTRAEWRREAQRIRAIARWVAENQQPPAPAPVVVPVVATTNPTSVWAEPTAEQQPVPRSQHPDLIDRRNRGLSLTSGYAR